MLRQTRAPEEGAVWIAADAHLSPAHPRRNERFFSFLRGAAKKECRALYLLGDVFDLWLGDEQETGDGEDGVGAQTKKELQNLAAEGVKVYLQRGNRDFLLGERFASAANCELIADEHILSAAGKKLLLAHGDLFCGDFSYLLFRRVVRSRAARLLYAAMPKTARKKTAKNLRARSRRNRRPPTFSRPAAEALMRKNNCHTLIHGHFHSPADEQWQTQKNETFRRISLPDWESPPEKLAPEESPPIFVIPAPPVIPAKAGIHTNPTEKTRPRYTYGES